MIYSRHRRSFVADLSVKETFEVSYVKSCGLRGFDMAVCSIDESALFQLYHECLKNCAL
jgi:hypothetical protein